MEKITPKDSSNSLPISIVGVSNGLSGVQNDFAAKRSDQGPNGFSEKLSAAMDKPESSEPVAKKSYTKPVKNDQAEEKPEAMQSGLPIGLAVTQQEIATPVDVRCPVLPEAAPTAVVSNPTGILENLMQNKDVIATAAQMFMGPVAGIATTVAATALQGMVKTATPTTEAPPDSGIDSMLMGRSLETAQPKVENAAMPISTDTSQSMEGSTLDSSLQPVLGLKRQVIASEAPMQSATSQNPVVPSVEVATAAQQQPVQQSVQQSGVTIDPQIQQDILSVQVSTGPKIALVPNASATPAKVEVKSTAVSTEPVTGVVEQSNDPIVVSTTEKELPKEYLGREESESLLKSDDKTDSIAMAAVQFDKVLNSAEPGAIAREVAPQQKQDPYAVARQVMDGMSISTDRLQSSQVIITLKPEHLGEVTVKINVDGDKVTAAFHAASSEVRAILESSLPQLRQEMSQQGWNFDSEGVYGGMKESFSNQQQQQPPAHEQPQITQRASRDVYDDTVAFTNTGRLQLTSSAAVDYRI